ncbi:HAD family hydrolase [Streptomyces sp. TRM66268-LWL]|uniref:HAD family hydrolase n=1 Tax=Streptomyces polyasparticus TaxID=2767826 RepID=A0ABR7SV20_9ACTN|nr:HAD family hydrolase [Streptomyces polyasparticus]MBC9718452.1 HAD family hydrolase [Streptomyces polyasparticus]
MSEHTRTADGRLRHRPWQGVRGVCFDLGGTLVQIAEEPTTGQVAQILGISLPRARSEMVRRAKRTMISPKELASELAADFDRPALMAPLTRTLTAARERAGNPDLFDDVLPTLRPLRERGYRLFALTNSLGSSVPENAPPYAELLDAIVYSARTGHCKPEPGAFAAVEHLADLAPAELLHVGDSARADVAGAVNAGWHAAHLQRGVPPAERTVGAGICRIHTLSTLLHLLPAHAVAPSLTSPDSEAR